MGKKRKGFEALDWILLVLLTAGLLAVLIPFLNVIAISFTSYKEYMQSTWVVWPKNPTLDAYKELFKDSRILIGYKTTLMYLLVGLPLNLLLCVTLAYALSRKGWPGRKVILMLVLFTMIFNGGIVPMYLVMKSFNLTNTIWSVILAQGMNTFNMILIYNYFCSLPEALVESASVDYYGTDHRSTGKTNPGNRGTFRCRTALERILYVHDFPAFQRFPVVAASITFYRYGLAGSRYRFPNRRRRRTELYRCD